MKLVTVTGEIGSAALRNSASHRLALRRRETLWAWLSLLVLMICWDAATRLDEKVSPPRPRFAETEERSAQNALMPVRARPTVN